MPPITTGTLRFVVGIVVLLFGVLLAAQVLPATPIAVGALFAACGLAFMLP